MRNDGGFCQLKVDFYEFSAITIEIKLCILNFGTVYTKRKKLNFDAD